MFTGFHIDVPRDVMDAEFPIVGATCRGCSEVRHECFFPFATKDHSEGGPRSWYCRFCKNKVEARRRRANLEA